jgi:hypothetical protein
MNKRSMFIVIGLVLVAVLALTYGLAVAQDTAPGVEPAGPEVTTDSVDPYMPVQGRLTDASGNPLNGTVVITFSLYAVSSGGTALCRDVNSVTVSNGLFNSNIWGNCTQDVVNGQQLYLGIKVEADEEMTPRRPIYVVPYAWSLRPGAVISATYGGDAIVHIENWGSTGRGLRSYAMYTATANYGVVGASRSPDGYGGYFYNSGGGIGLWGFTDGTNRPAIFGCVAASSGSCDEGTNPAGVRGTSAEGDGVMGITSNATFRGVYAQNTANGIALAAYNNSSDTTNHNNPTAYLVQANSNGDFVVGASSYLGSRLWRVDRTGKGFFNNGTQASGADFAEQIAVQGEEKDYEPGDVLVISSQADRAVEFSAQPFATAVIGVYSTQPALLGGAPDQNDPLAGIPVAITGIVPCKVSAENGAIKRGDLLVTAGLPGYAMRAGSNPPQGTVLGKAMGQLDAGTGVIQVLVTLQ